MDETFNFLHYKLELEYKIINKECISDIFYLIPECDDAKVVITYTSDENIVLKRNYNNDKLSDFLGTLQTIADDGDVVSVEISIEKNLLNNAVNIYSYRDVEKWILRKDLIDFFALVSTLKGKCSSNGLLTCVCLFDDTNIKTNFFNFTNPKSQNGRNLNFDYEEKTILEKKNQISHIENLPANITPSDFYILYSDKDYELTRYINYACFIISLAFISDQSVINKNSVDFTINGYRQINDSVNLNVKDNNNINFYEIYRWLYFDGNINDKAQIARNIISLHCRYSRIQNIDKLVLESIKSNYKLYLKDNVKDFLQLKEQVSNSMQGYCNNMSEAINNFSGYLKKNFLAAFGYIIALFLADVIDLKPKIIIDGKGIIITYALIIASLLYLLVSVQELNRKNKYFESIIDGLKKYYGDILDDNIIKDIIDENPIYTTALKNFESSRKSTTIIWFLSTIIAFIVLFCIQNL